MIPYPQIDPVLIHAGPIKVRWYGLMYVIGFIAAYFVLRSQIRRRPIGLDQEGIYDFLSSAAFGVILGGRLGYVLFYNLSYYVSHPLEVFAVWEGGMSFHGGFIGVLIAGWLFTRKRGIPFMDLADLAVLPVPIALFMGRIGNFINGELFGRETDVPWCMEFPMGGPICRHPSELYEAGMEGILLFLVLFFLSRRNLPKGVVFWSFIGGYGVFRTIGEFFRQPDIQIGFLFDGITMGQLLSVPMAILGIGMAIRAYRVPSEGPSGLPPTQI